MKLYSTRWEEPFSDPKALHTALHSRRYSSPIDLGFIQGHEIRKNPNTPIDLPFVEGKQSFQLVRHGQVAFSFLCGLADDEVLSLAIHIHRGPMLVPLRILLPRVLRAVEDELFTSRHHVCRLHLDFLAADRAAGEVQVRVAGECLGLPLGQRLSVRPDVDLPPRGPEVAIDGQAGRDRLGLEHLADLFDEVFEVFVDLEHGGDVVDGDL